MNAGSTFAYDPTHSMATKGAIRQRAMATRAGVTTGSLVSSSDIGGRPLTLIALITDVMRRQCK